MQLTRQGLLPPQQLLLHVPYEQLDQLRLVQRFEQVVGGSQLQGIGEHTSDAVFNMVALYLSDDSERFFAGV